MHGNDIMIIEQKGGFLMAEIAEKRKLLYTSSSNRLLYLFVP